jgi:hypothetical protein
MKNQNIPLTQIRRLFELVKTSLFLMMLAVATKRKTKMRKSIYSTALLVGALLTAIPLTLHAFRLADGNDWNTSSENERKAYLVGISNMISVGNAYDIKKIPGEDRTFMRQAYLGLGRTTIPEAIQHIDAWYRSNPERLDVPVLSVLWIDIVKPKTNQSE